MKFCNWLVRCQADTAGRFVSFLPVVQQFSNNVHFYAAQRGRVNEDDLENWQPQHVLKRKREKKKEVGTGACLPPSYITFLLPTLTQRFGDWRLKMPLLSHSCWTYNRSLSAVWGPLSSRIVIKKFSTNLHGGTAVGPLEDMRQCGHFLLKTCRTCLTLQQQQQQSQSVSLFLCNSLHYAQDFPKFEIWREVFCSFIYFYFFYCIYTLTQIMPVTTHNIFLPGNTTLFFLNFWFSCKKKKLFQTWQEMKSAVCFASWSQVSSAVAKTHQNSSKPIS